MRPLNLCFLLLIFASASVLNAVEIHRINIKDLASYLDRYESPVYSDGENLSFDDCGKWNRTVSLLAPWNAAVWDSDRYNFCNGLLVSDSAIVCYDYWHFRYKHWQPAYVEFGLCSNENDFMCTGERVKILNVTQLDVTRYVKYIIFETEKIKLVPNYVWPICLLGRLNGHGISASLYFWGRLINHKTIEFTSAEECLRDKVTKYFVEKYPDLKMLCYKDNHTTEIYTHFLVKFAARYYLRGNPLVMSGALKVIVDVLPFVRSIAELASGINIMPVVPPATPAMRFLGSENLSFPYCGRRSTRDTPEGLFSANIVHGQHARKGNHPWHAEIRYKDSDMKHGFCAGSLISRKVVLTAAHCIFDYNEIITAEELTVTVGLYDVTKRNVGGIQTASPTAIEVHANYSNTVKNWENDVALLVFDGGFTLTDKVRPICLWNEDSDLEKIVDKRTALAGWGLDERFVRPNVLQTASMPIRTHRDCYLKGRSFFGKYLKPGKNFCAGHVNGTNACNGDSGSGLALEKNGRWYIRGITSFGKGKKSENGTTCNPKSYTLFTDVSTYLKWIVDKSPDIVKRKNNHSL